MNEHDILHQTPLKEVFNLRWHIQHLMDENEDENENPLSEENWMKLTNWKFIEYVIHHKHSMTPEQLKQKPLEEIIKIQHEKLDTEEGESNEKEEETTTSSGSFLSRENAWRIFSIMVIFVLTSAKIEPHVRILTFSLSYFGK